MRVLTAGRRRGHQSEGRELAFSTALGASQPGPPLAFGALRQAEEPQHQRATGAREGGNDARTGMPARVLAGALCVQRFDGSLNSAIHITYRISLRSSSMPEPRDPLLKVLIVFLFVCSEGLVTKKGSEGPPPPAEGLRGGGSLLPRPPRRKQRELWGTVHKGWEL